MNVLIVDDEQYKITDVKRLIASAVDKFNSGNKGTGSKLEVLINSVTGVMDAIKSLDTKYDIIVLDYTLRGNTIIKGPELAEIIRATYSGRGVSRKMKTELNRNSNKDSFIVGYHSNWCGGRESLEMLNQYTGILDCAINDAMDNDYKENRFGIVIRESANKINN